MVKLSPEVTKRQRQIIIGTIFGGSSIVQPAKGKSCYLAMRDKNAKWLEFKAFQLQSIASLEPFTIEKTNRWHSYCCSFLSEMRQSFYRKSGKRKLDLDLLSSLWDVGLAIWFGDSAKRRGKDLILNTHIWGLANNKIILNYFGLIDCAGEIIKERKYLRIKFGEKSTNKILRIISHELPIFLHL